MGLTTAELCASVPRPSSNSEPLRWLAVYTRSRHESVVAEQLQSKGLEILLPTYVRMSRWSDRIRRIEAPLFPGYVFVRVGESERHRVLQTHGVVKIVSRAGIPVPLPDAEVERLRFCIEHPGAIEPHPYLRVGQRVRVKHGPFQGWEGVLVEKKNSARLVITVEQIMKSVSIDISGVDVEPIG